MQTLLQDVRYAVRMLTKNPGFTAVAVLTLALGIGANTAIFTAVNSVLLSTLPVKNASELVMLSDPDAHGMSMGSQDGDRSLFTYAEFQAISTTNHVFSGVLAEESGAGRMNVAVDATGRIAEGTPAQVSMVSGSFFQVLGANPAIGRAFGTEVDEKRDASPVAVVSYGFWQGRLGGAVSALGKKIRIRNTSYDVVGVAPQHFFGTTVGSAPDIWVPLTMQSEMYPGEDWLTVEKDPVEKTEWLQVMARRKPGVTVAQAKADAELVFQQYLQSQIGTGVTDNNRDFLNQHVHLTEGSHGGSVVRDQFGKPLLILMGVVGLVLVIACANVANLLLARAASRQKEIAVRISLGAGPGRLFRQLLTESLLLAGIGGAVGLLLAQWADALLLQLVSRSASPIPLNLQPDVKILGFTLGVSLLTGILFGVAPALRAARVDLNAVLKGNARGVVGGSAARGGRVPLGKMLVIGQVAVSLLLLIVAGLFVHSFAKLTQVNLGFDREHLVIFEVSPVTAGYTQPATMQLYKDLLARIGGVPGVRGVTLSHNGLFSGSESSDQIKIDAYTPKSGQKMNARFDHVGPNYFSTVGIPVLAGREIGPQDEGNGQRVGVINQTMARYFFGDESPIGRRIWDTFPTSYTDFVVVGVVADAKYNQVSEETPRRFYVPVFQPIEASEVRFARFEVRAAGDPSTIASGVREAVKQTAPALPPIEMETVDARVSRSLTSDRMITKLAGFFGALAALLACIGLYGIMAYAVAARANEIGIRMALGAQGSDVRWLVLRESLLLVAVGVAIGLPTVAGTSKLISSLLFGLTPADPLTISLATVLMFVVAGVASYAPAWRASRIDPLVALRYE